MGKVQRLYRSIEQAIDAAGVVADVNFRDQQLTQPQACGLQGWRILADKWVLEDRVVAPDGFDELALLFEAARFGQILDQV